MRPQPEDAPFLVPRPVPSKLPIEGTRVLPLQYLRLLSGQLVRTVRPSHRRKTSGDDRKIPSQARAVPIGSRDMTPAAT